MCSLQAALQAHAPPLDALRTSSAAFEYSEPLPTQGSILFSVSWMPLREEQVLNGTLHVHLLRANGLKAMDRNGKSDPYVKLELAGQKHRSKVKQRTLNPEWNEKFSL